MAGAGGVLLAHFDGYLNPKSFEFIKSFEILIMIILGGLGSIVGSVLGAIPVDDFAGSVCAALPSTAW